MCDGELDDTETEMKRSQSGLLPDGHEEQTSTTG
jgi:hypothetical protein